MATFLYKAKDSKGGLISGALEADSKGTAVARLQSMGYFPVSIDERKEKSKGLGGLLGARRIRSADLAMFDRQMADLIGSSIPLVKALAIMRNQTPNPALRQIIESVESDVSAGDSLADAFAKHPRVFNPLMVAMVRAGETGGMLDAVLQRLADFSETEEELRGKIKSALAYPAVMVIVGTIVLFILLTVVIPKIVGIFTQLNQTLPLPTVVLLATTSFLAKWKWALIAGTALAITTLARFAHSEEGGRLLDRTKLRLPVMADIVVKRDIGRFSRTLGELLRNGVPILTAFRIAQNVLGNRIIAAEVAKAPDALSQGSNVASALRDSPHFPPVVLNMVAIGEETGNLPEALLKIAKSYEGQVDRSMKTLTSLLEPLIILVMGIVVGLIVIAILLPIFSLDPTSGAM